MKTTRILSFVLSILMLVAVLAVSVSAKTGDLNGDNKVTSKDYMMLKRYCLNTFDLNDEQLVAGDINGDGNVNSKDYMMLKRVCLGTYTLEVDPVITAIENTLETKGELTTTFPAQSGGKEGVATVSFEMVNGVMSLCGNLKVESLGAVVDIVVPMPSVKSEYTFSGQATYGEIVIDITGKLVAAEYSRKTQTIDVEFESNNEAALELLGDALIPTCKSAMNEFLAQANTLLVDSESGVTIKDLGFVKYFEEITPIAE